MCTPILLYVVAYHLAFRRVHSDSQLTAEISEAVLRIPMAARTARAGRSKVGEQIIAWFTSPRGLE